MFDWRYVWIIFFFFANGRWVVCSGVEWIECFYVFAGCFFCCESGVGLFWKKLLMYTGPGRGYVIVIVNAD